jgi:hypothetical protein
VTTEPIAACRGGSGIGIPSGQDPLARRAHVTDLITAIEPTGNLVAQIVTQTERLLRGTSRLAALT